MFTLYFHTHIKTVRFYWVNRHGFLKHSQMAFFSLNLSIFLICYLLYIHNLCMCSTGIISVTNLYLLQINDLMYLLSSHLLPQAN